MSDDSNSTDLGIEEAFGNVYCGVHDRAFFHRLAQYGIVPQTEKEADDLRAISAKVVAASANPALQQAANQESRFAKASAALDEALADQGIMSAQQKQAAESGLSNEAQAAAWELAQDPLIFKSAEVLQAAREAEPAKAE